MKVLVQSDDYGLTKGVVDASCDAFENGFLKCTGLFTNMPSSAYAASKIKDYPHICFGIDINVATGPCVSDKNLIPHLVNKETGEFVQTTERLKDGNFAEKLFWPYEECIIEARAQVEKFIELTGRKPEYLCPHSSSGETEYLKAIGDVAREYGLPFRQEVLERFGFKRAQELAVRYKYMAEAKEYSNPKEAMKQLDIYTYENQMLNEVEPTLRYLQELLCEGAEYVYLGGHCGWASADLFTYTRCNINRIFDHEMYTSTKIMQWFKDNNVQLISYRDLPMM